MTDDLNNLLAHADAMPPPVVPVSAIAARAIALADRRRTRRRAAAAVGACVIAGLSIALVLPVALHHRPQPQGPTVAQLQAELIQLRARADQLAAELDALRAARSDPAPGEVLARAAVEQQRLQAAFALLHTAERTNDPALATATYRRTAAAFPETTYAAAARQRLNAER